MQRLPSYLKRGIINTDNTKLVRAILKENCLNTVCESARCPNKNECYSKNTATFLIMGDVCTRNCRFCNISEGRPLPLDSEEPEKIAIAVKELNLKYVVITSVTRDDLSDNGSGHFKEVILKIRENTPDVKIEVLTPDFKGNINDIYTVLETMPDVFNHNIETVPSLYKIVRPQASYKQSVEFLKYIKNAKPEILTKTGLMVGLGETFDELTEVFEDLKSINCDIITIGQYIQPSKNHLPVQRYYEPLEYKQLEEIAKKIGIKHTFFSPLTRSSYKAFEVFEKN